MAQPTFISLGPAPSTGPEGTVQSSDIIQAGGNRGTVTGAVQAIVVDPGDANTIWIGTPNGGVWVTHDGGATWAPLTDKQSSLSIASLSLDPNDATNNTLIAGIGKTSSGFVGPGFRSGSLDGLLYSTNGGTDWAPLGKSTLGGQTVVGVAARGTTLLAATFDVWSPTDPTGGLYRSTNTGLTFDASISGLPAGHPVTSLVGDPTTPTILYAAVTSPNNTGGKSFADTAVYVSTDTGASWTAKFTATNSGGLISAATQTIARIAVNAALNEIAVGLVDVSTGMMAGVFLSTDGGTNWTQLNVPQTNPTRQALTNFAIALDPTNSGVVYVTGAIYNASPFTVTAYRVTTAGATPISDNNDGTTPTPPNNTANRTSVHGDSRAIAFDAGRLILRHRRRHLRPYQSDGCDRRLEQPQRQRPCHQRNLCDRLRRQQRPVADRRAGHRRRLREQSWRAGFYGDRRRRWPQRDGQRPDCQYHQHRAL